MRKKLNTEHKSGRLVTKVLNPEQERKIAKWQRNTEMTQLLNSRLKDRNALDVLKVDPII